MKKNVFLILATVFVFNFSLNAQVEDSLSINSTKINSYKFYSIENYNFPFKIMDKKNMWFDFKINLSTVKKPFFQKYNNISMLTDFYENNNDGTYTYIMSRNNLENLYRGVKIDSYNPKGMSSNGKSIIFGVFGTILDKLQN